MSEKYNDDSIRALKGAERVRQRPSAILGSSGLLGAYHTVTEIIGNSMDEVSAGYGDKVTITLYEDGSLSVEDKGRGVPLGWNEAEGRHNWDLIFNELYAGGKYDDDNSNYEFSLGLNGLGSASTQYSSEFFTVVSKREDGIYTKEFKKGYPVDEEPAVHEPNETGETGTFIHWKPDSEVFSDVNITAEMLKAPLESQAHLNQITVAFVNKKTGEETIYVGKGMEEFFREKLGSNLIELFSKSATTSGSENGKKYKAKIDVILGITKEIPSSIALHHHNTGVMKQGYHVLGYEAALEEFFKKVSKQYDVKIKQYDYTNFISVLTSTYANVNATSFQNQTKDGVDNPFIYQMVKESVLEILEESLAMKKESVVSLIESVVETAQTRERVKELEKLEKEANKVQSKKREKPEKFEDCKSNDPEITELYIMEGDSAKGSCKKARFGEFQALMPVVGKPPNALKTPVKKLIENKVIRNLASVIGTGFDIEGLNTFDMSKRKFSKFIIATDADKDGYQIRVLLYTIFYRLFPELLKQGYVYVVETPLFEIITTDGEVTPAYDIAHKDELLKQFKEEGRSVKLITRAKGLGQNSKELLNKSAMNPEYRRLIQLDIDIKDHIIRDVSNMLFGDDKNNERKQFIFDLLAKTMETNASLEDLSMTVDAVMEDDEVDEEVEEGAVDVTEKAM